MATQRFDRRIVILDLSLDTDDKSKIISSVTMRPVAVNPTKRLALDQDVGRPRERTARAGRYRTCIIQVNRSDIHCEREVNRTLYVSILGAAESVM